MFVVLLEYIKPLPEVDRHMKAHMLFLKTCYDSKIFVASGRKIPRTGGVILARGLTKPELEKVMAEDPFVKNGVATFQVVEFQTSQVAAGFEALKD